MATHVIVLDAKRDREFFKQQRKDPVIKLLLESGDRVVVCAHCRMVFLEDTWGEIRGKFGHGLETLPDLPADPAFSRWTREDRASASTQTTGAAQSHASPPTEPRWSSTAEPSVARPGPSAARQAWSEVLNGARRLADETPEAWWGIVDRARQLSNRANRIRSSNTGALKLREIPFQLREIPFKLREVKPY